VVHIVVLPALFAYRRKLRMKVYQITARTPCKDHKKYISHHSKAILCSPLDVVGSLGAGGGGGGGMLGVADCGTEGA
jgi:hypothetical protein